MNPEAKNRIIRLAVLGTLGVLLAALLAGGLYLRHMVGLVRSAEENTVATLSQEELEAPFPCLYDTPFSACCQWFCLQKVPGFPKKSGDFCQIVFRKSRTSFRLFSTRRCACCALARYSSSRV